MSTFLLEDSEIEGLRTSGVYFFQFLIFRKDQLVNMNDGSNEG